MDWPTIFALLLTALMAAVMVIDASRYVIPNSLNLFLLGLYPFAAYLLGLAWPMALLAAGIALIIGMGIFALGFMGGGDIKLLVVLMLWTGWHVTSAYFLFLTGVCGGVLVIVILLARFFLPPLFKHRTLPRLLTRKQPVPYGIAIAAGFLVVLWSGQIMGLPVTVQF